MANLNRRNFIGRVGLTAAGMMLLQAGGCASPSVSVAGGSAASASSDEVAARFATPPDECGPWVYWFWLDVNVTRAGITADLEAMKAVGISGVLIFDDDVGTPPSFNGVKFGDPKWYELFKFACSEANRLGMHINVNNDAGWCGSGGPWITPEMSMQRVVWSQTLIAGGKPVDEILPQPSTVLNFYRDIAVLAVPAPASVNSAAVTASSSKPGHPPIIVSQNAAHYNIDRFWQSHGWTAPEWLCFEYPRPFRADTLLLTPKFCWGPRKIEMQCSENGRDWKTLATAEVDKTETLQQFTFPPTTARYFRILMLSNYSIFGGDVVSPPKEQNVQICNARFCLRSNAWVDQTGAGYRMRSVYDDVNTEYNIPAPATWPQLRAEQDIPGNSIIDLSTSLDKEGRLKWDAPAGHWAILRFGYTTTGVPNHPAPAGGLGLECDKLSRKAVQLQFNSLMGKILKYVGPADRKAIVSTHIDSWEIGSQNWSPDFQLEFKRRRGYDLTRYLPIMTGRVIENLETSERFLWDLRKTVGDLLVENYAAAMREIAERHGLRLSIEAYQGEPASDMRYAGQAFEPMSECWAWPRYGLDSIVAEMTSAGHVYGHNIIGQETFTSMSDEKWLGHPAVVKDIGDWCFCEGINRFVIHRYAMQPWTNPHYAPGVSMGPYGLHYERTETWWHVTKPWHQYVARCSYMLRQGNFVADVCYMQAEGEPQEFDPLNRGQPEPTTGYSNFHTKVAPPGRPGYNYDGCPPEVVLARMEYKDGFLTLPGGMKYRVLVLPDSPAMTPQLLGKIKKLVEAGATVIGSRPWKSPSLENFPHCDKQVEQLAAELWDTGKIKSGQSAAQVLAARGIAPDFQCDQPMVRWTHRHTPDMDIYFLANGKAAEDYPYSGESLLANCAFRLTGARPEFWNPETGTISPAPVYKTSDGRTYLPIAFKPKGSVFVVFRHHASVEPADPVQRISRSGRELLSVPNKFPTQVSELACQQAVALAVQSNGGLMARIAVPGSYEFTFASGKLCTVEVLEIPMPITVNGPWNVRFPLGWGTPAEIHLDQLIAWNKHPDAGVRYFSGTAEYRTEFDIPNDLLTPERRTYLDLGEVAVMAHVVLNGHDVGILWKPPFDLDVTPALIAGRNQLIIRVTNLWINRMIGDEQLPEDCDRAADGSLLKWPQWLLDGKPSPTGRLTFTTWQLWHKTDPLVESGLIGPVRLRTVLSKDIKV